MERGDHLKAVLVSGPAILGEDFPTGHFRGPGRVELNDPIVDGRSDWLGFRGFIGGLIDASLAQHVSEHHITTAQCPLRAIDGIADAGGLGNARKHGPLGQGEFL